MKIDEKLRKSMDQRLEALRTDRYSWLIHWRELAAFILPRRYIWLVENEKNNYRGAPLNQNIIDSTATIAARTCSSGMMAGITNPTRPWFRLRIAGFEYPDEHPVALWLDEVQKRMMRVFAESNFYSSMNIVYEDLVVFGTAAQLIYEDYENVIHCYNPCLGEYFVQNDAKGLGAVFYREYVYTLTQMAEEFGEENLEEPDRRLLANSSNWTQKYIICHAIEPNSPHMPGIPTKFAFRECYWKKGSGPGEALRLRGYNENPANVPRWSTVGNDAYGRSPGMDALPDVKQLQQEQKRKAQGIDKMVNPPMVADVQLKHQPASLLPGGITYVSGNSQVGYKPAFTPNIPINDLMLDIQEVQNRIRTVFFNDLFQMISQLQTVRSATEIDARREEKLVMLGPVIERFENEALAPAVNRVYNIMARGGILPEPPEAIRGRPLDIQFVSMMAEAQRAAETAGMERWAATVGNMAAVKPTILDVLNEDEFARQYADRLAVSPLLLRSPEEVAAQRQAREQQAQAAQAAELAPAAVQGAAVLSKTEVGGGQNALARMMGA